MLAQENISAFLRAARGVGVREFELFNTDDLFVNKDIAQVCVCGVGGGGCVI